ncbi:hypothetical protein [Clostridium perfringens]|uniref:hypothetical protein n=1 Tax=Clostridium perfringens TaxID=1502 RepID=UPI000E0C9234|nr:hypothetical protein [Clostridium perfringens]AXH51106.1 hypothetical protein C8114_00230 [Clostridium perfringens]
MADKEVLRENNRWEEFNSIIDSEHLDIKEKGVLLILFRFVNYKTCYADPSRALIKKLTNIKKDETLDKIINSLIDKKILIKYVQKGKRTQYIIKLPLKNVGTPINEGTTKNGSIVPPKNGSIVPPKNGGQKENKRKVKENIYSSLENELDTKEIEKDLINKINSKYSKDLIKEELEKLKDKDVSKLDLLKELDKNLKYKLKDNSNQDIEEIWSLYPLKKGKASAIKKIPKLLKEYGKEQIIRCIERYIEEIKKENKSKEFILHGSTFFNGRYIDYLDCNYQEDIITKSKEETKRRQTNLDDL